MICDHLESEVLDQAKKCKIVLQLYFVRVVNPYLKLSVP